MSDHIGHDPGTDLDTGLPLDLEELIRSGELERKLQAGEITSEQAAEIYQAAQRRRTAEYGPDLDTDEEGQLTTGGFGSGQGMGKQRTQQDKGGVV